MSKDLVELLNNASELTIDSCIKYIEKLDESPSVKWKHSVLANQVVLHTDKYYYKLYAFDELGKFNSVIRHKLAEIYQSYGIEWDIITLETKEGYIDVERREILDVCQIWSDDILKNYSNTLRLLEKSIGLDEVLQQIKDEFSDVVKIKLIRHCVNKPIDYAIYKDKIILLDDADWFLTLVDNNNNGIMHRVAPVINIRLFGEDWIFASNVLRRHKHFTTTMLFEPIDKFFIFKYKNAIETFASLKNELYRMLDNNVKLFLDEDKKYIDISYVNEENDKLYTNNTGRKSFQWELWHYCNSLCKFCYLGKENRVHNKARQLQSLEDFNEAIDHLDFDVYNNISIIGGEFFQGQLDDKEIHDKFFATMRKIFDLYLNRKIGSIWITCTLTIGDQKHLYELLDLADILGVEPVKDYNASGLWLCTSWDAKGRFHTKEMQDNWEYHMLNIKKRHPWVKFNTTIILQQALVDMYLNGEYKPKEFMEKYSTTLFYKQCGLNNTDFSNSRNDEEFDAYWASLKKEYNKNIGFEFFPTRESFVKFLAKYYKDDFDTFDRLYNIQYRADELHRNFNYKEHDYLIMRDKNSKVEEKTVRVNKCGHLYYYAPYSDSNKCCICDKQIITQ